MVVMVFLRTFQLSRRFSLAVLVLALGGCGAGEGSGLRAELEQARARWQDNGPAHYGIPQARSCFCPPPFRWTVVVHDGVPAFIDYVEDPGGVQSTRTLEQAALQQAMSVEQAFDWIGREIDVAARVEARFHPVLGYPTSITVDRIAGAVDDEVTWAFGDPVAIGACTEIGCSDVLRVVLRPGAGGFPEGGYEVTVSTPQPQGTLVERCAFRVSTSPAECVQPFCVFDADCAASAGADRITVPFRVIEGPLGIDVRIDGASVAMDMVEPEYIRAQPNGPLCGPVCYQYEHEVPLP